MDRRQPAAAVALHAAVLDLPQLRVVGRAPSRELEQDAVSGDFEGRSIDALGDLLTDLAESEQDGLLDGGQLLVALHPLVGGAAVLRRLERGPQLVVALQRDLLDDVLLARLLPELGLEVEQMEDVASQIRELPARERPRGPIVRLQALLEIHVEPRAHQGGQSRRLLAQEACCDRRVPHVGEAQAAVGEHARVERQVVENLGGAVGAEGLGERAEVEREGVDDGDRELTALVPRQLQRAELAPVGVQAVALAVQRDARGLKAALGDCLKLPRQGDEVGTGHRRLDRRRAPP